jgi:hypothetical protein
MNIQKSILQLMILFISSYNFAQNELRVVTKKKPTFRQLSIEPAIGIHTNYGTDLLITNLVQWNPYKHLAFASHSSYNINNPFLREFNGIKAEYNYTLNQKIGVGVTVYGKKSSHTLFFLGGIKYTSFKETIIDPALDRTSIAINTTSPDYGVMYSYKQGLKKYFFTFRTYIPLYPWPLKGNNINYIDDNLKNIALELGVGVKIN